MLVFDYIKDFNKIIQSINFLSSSNEHTLKNKLFLIEKEIGNIPKECNTFDLFTFYTHIYNILNQSSDQSLLINSCFEVLIESTHSKNSDIRKIIQDLNFLPGLLKQLVFMHGEKEENLTKLLALLKDLLRLDNELDEHNMKCLIASLTDHVINSNNQKIIKLSLHILANLAMTNQNAKCLIRKTVRATEVQDKISKFDSLFEAKFYIIIMGEFLPKDFHPLIIMSLKAISSGVNVLNIEPIYHSIDLLKYAKESPAMIADHSNITENDEILKYSQILNEQLMSQVNDDERNDESKEYFQVILEYLTQLLELDVKLVTVIEGFSKQLFKSKYSRSSQALKYLSSYISLGGRFSLLDKSIESLIEYFNDESNRISSNQKYAFLKTLKILHNNEKLDNTHFQTLHHYVEGILKSLKECKVENIDAETISLTIYFLDMLYALCQDSDIFRDSLEKILNLEILPCIIAKGYGLKNEEVLCVLFSLTSMEKFPNAQVAKLMSISHHWNRKTYSYTDYKEKLSTSTSFSKYLNTKLYQELEDLIKKVNRKIDGNELKSLDVSDILSLYRQKNTYLQVHLNSANKSLEKFADLCNEVQQQNCILTKLGEKYEMSNWCLQHEKEQIIKENKGLMIENQRFASAADTLKLKIEKEITQNINVKKSITVKDMEIKRLLAEKNLMENDKLKFKIVQKENETRIQQLKKELEEEKKLRAEEVTKAVNDQKICNEKRLVAEKENLSLLDIVKMNEKDLLQKQNKIEQLEADLKEAEKIQSSIMNLMQKNKRN